MVATFLCVKYKWAIWFTIIIYFIFIIHNQGRQHKVQKKRPVATGWLQTINVIMFLSLEEKWEILLFFPIIFINNHGKQDKMQKI